jgi:hypothetical protein
VAEVEAEEAADMELVEAVAEGMAEMEAAVASELK